MATRSLIDCGKFDARHPLVRVGFRVEQPPVSASSIQDHARCQRYFMFRYRLGLVRRLAAPSAAMDGTWTHEAMRLLTTGVDFAEVTRQLQAVCRATIDAATDQHGMIQAGYAESLTRMLKKALAAGWAFWRLAQDLNLPMADSLTSEIVGTEQVIACEIPYGRARIQLAGTLDLLTRDKRDGTELIHDYKRYSGRPSERALTASIEPQPWVYRLLAESAGLHPKKMVHWIMEVQTIRQKSKPPETWDDYCERVKRWYVEKAQERPDDPPLVASDTSLDGPSLTRERMNILRLVHKASTAPRVTADAFPKTGAPHACKAYNRLCPYHELCVSCPALWPDKILNNFKQEFRYDNRGDSDADGDGD